MSFKSNETVKIWDPLTRIFHWSLACLFLLAYLTEDNWMTVHSYAGYFIASLVGFRLIWGLIGTHHARFSNFAASPQDLLSYLKQLVKGKAKRYLGHNPAGAAMIFSLLASLSMTALSGVILLATEGQGPLATSILAALPEDPLEEVHEFFANLTLLMVLVHIGGVLLSSLLHRENLIKAMINGKKQK